MSLSIDGMMNQYKEYLSSGSSSASADKIQGSLANKDFSTSTKDELMEACKEFEAYFVEQMFEAMKKMVPENEEENDGSIAAGMSDGSSYMDYFGDMLTQEYASSAAESNGGQGIGLAQMLYEQMKRNYGIED